jgi:hypothetical protein
MFTYEKKQHKKDGHEYLEITGFDGKVTDMVVPGEIDGMTVEAIGNHAFSGRGDIVSISLPETVKTLYGFAFHDCRNLKKITLFDSLDDYYDGVCRQCDSLEEIELTVKRSWYEVIRNFLADNDKTLRFLVHSLKADSAEEYETACLTFPGYVYDFNENTMARTIQFTIAGSGYAYRECVDRRKIDFRQYDNLFAKAVIDGPVIAEDIAIGRLLFPTQLDVGSRKKYEDYLRENGSSVLKRLIDRAMEQPQALETLKKLLELSLFVEIDIDNAIKYSAAVGGTVISAVIMDLQGCKSEADSGFFL